MMRRTLTALVVLAALTGTLAPAGASTPWTNVSTWFPVHERTVWLSADADELAIAVWEGATVCEDRVPLAGGALVTDSVNFARLAATTRCGPLELIWTRAQSSRTSAVPLVEIWREQPCDGPAFPPIVSITHVRVGALAWKTEELRVSGMFGAHRVNTSGTIWSQPLQPIYHTQVGRCMR